MMLLLLNALFCTYACAAILPVPPPQTGTTTLPLPLIDTTGIDVSPKEIEADGDVQIDIDTGCDTQDSVPVLVGEPLDLAATLAMINQQSWTSKSESERESEQLSTSPSTSHRTAAKMDPKNPTKELPKLRAWHGTGVSSGSSVRGSRMRNFVRDQVLTTDQFPFSAIGRIAFQRGRADSGGWCSGTLVGRNLLLTASHCFPWEGDGAPEERRMVFMPGYNVGQEPFGEVAVSRCRGVPNVINVTGADYVVCRLCAPLGDVTGWFGTQWWDPHSLGYEYTARRWQSSGYPTDLPFSGHAQMLQGGLAITGLTPVGIGALKLKSTVFASAGWSGGPLWGAVDGEPRVVGVTSGGERDCRESESGACDGLDQVDDYHDVTAGGQLMTELVEYGQRRWRVLEREETTVLRPGNQTTGKQRKKPLIPSPLPRKPEKMELAPAGNSKARSVWVPGREWTLGW